MIPVLTGLIFSTNAQAETCGGADIDGDGTNDLISHEGQCDGTDAIWCTENPATTDGDLGRYACGDIIGDGSEVGECAILSDWGSWCVFQEGESCSYTTSSSSSLYFGCGDASGGADVSMYCDYWDGTCKTGTDAACTPAEEGEDYDFTCSGTILINYCLSWGQGLGIDCTDDSVGGTGCSNGACTGLAAGETCNDTLWLCADGLDCEGLTDTELGTCTDNGGNTTDPSDSSDAGTIDDPADTSDAGSNGDDSETTDAGQTDGSTDGAATGTADGNSNGNTDGSADGSNDGTSDGTADGASNGTADGTTDGTSDGTTDGTTDGTAAGTADGTADGTSNGASDGASDGSTEGEAEENAEDQTPAPRLDAANNEAPAEGGFGCHVEGNTSSSNPLILAVFLAPWVLRRRRKR